MYNKVVQFLAAYNDHSLQKPHSTVLQIEIPNNGMVLIWPQSSMSSATIRPDNYRVISDLSSVQFNCSEKIQLSPIQNFFSVSPI